MISKKVNGYYFKCVLNTIVMFFLCVLAKLNYKNTIVCWTLCFNWSSSIFKKLTNYSVCQYGNVFIFSTCQHMLFRFSGCAVTNGNSMHIQCLNKHVSIKLHRAEQEKVQQANLEPWWTARNELRLLIKQLIDFMMKYL